MKVLHVISDENIGGAGILLTNLLKNMDHNRVSSIVALPQNSLLFSRIEGMKIPSIGLKHPCDRFSLQSIIELRKIIKRERIDIIHANAALCARIAGKSEGKVVLHTRHCCFAPQGIWKNRTVRFLGGACNRLLSNRVIATAEAAAKNLCQLGIPRDRIEVIINGSEAMREVDNDELLQYKRRFGIKEGDFCIGICARLEPYKGHETFLKAAKRLMSLHPELSFRFLIVGDGSEKSHLINLCQRMGLSHAVCFTGFVEDMAPIYRLLRINVNCSYGTETSCLALSEGMSAGVPFLATDFGGNCAMCGESDAGRIYPVGNVETLAELLSEIATDPEREERMRIAAKHRYMEKYTAAAMGEALTAVYENMMKG